jgi:hypothetical protein
LIFILVKYLFKTKDFLNVTRTTIWMAVFYSNNFFWGDICWLISRFPAQTVFFARVPGCRQRRGMPGAGIKKVLQNVMTLRRETTGKHLERY